MSNKTNQKYKEVVLSTIRISNFSNTAQNARQVISLLSTLSTHSTRRTSVLYDSQVAKTETKVSTRQAQLPTTTPKL